MNASARMPAIFFGHGNPMNALLDNAYTRAWRSEFGRRMRLGRALQSDLTARWLGDVLASMGRRWPVLAGLMLAGTRGRMA